MKQGHAIPILWTNVWIFQGERSIYIANHIMQLKIDNDCGLWQLVEWNSKPGSKKY